MTNDPTMTEDEIEKRRREILALVDDAIGSKPSEEPQLTAEQTQITPAAPITPPAPVKETPPSPLAAAAQQITQGPPRNETLEKVLSMLSDRVMRDQTTPEEKAMNTQWGQLEKQKLDQLTKGGDSAQDWAQGLGTAIPMLIGTIMDAATPNAYGQRGTGLGKIAEAGIQNAQNLANQRSQREQLNAHLAQQAQAIRKGYQDKDFDRLSKLGTMLSEQDRIKQAWMGLGYRGTEAALRANADARAQQVHDYLHGNGPESEKVKQIFRDHGVSEDKLAGLSVQGLRDVSHALNIDLDNENFWKQKLGQAGAQAAATAAAGENARSAAQASNAERDAATRGTLEYGGALGSAKAKIETAPAVNEATGETRKDMEASVTRFQKDMESPLKVAASMQSLFSKRNKDGSLPGLSRGARLVEGLGGRFLLSADAQSTLQAVDRTMEIYSRDQSGAAIAVPEEIRFARQVMGDPKASAREVEAAFRNFQRWNEQQIRGRAAANPDAAQKVVDAMGLRFNVLSPQARVRKEANKVAAPTSLMDLVTEPPRKAKAKSRPTIEDFD